MVKRNLKTWEHYLPHIEFAYNCSVHSSTHFCPFEIVYGFIPLSPLDLLALPLSEQTNLDGATKVESVCKLHEQVKANLESRNKRTATQHNK